MSGIFWRQFWLTLLVFVALTAMAYTLSRVASAYIRVGILRSQAQFYSDIVAEYPGNKAALVKNMRHRAEGLDLPIDFEIVPNGTSQLESQASESGGNPLLHPEQSVERDLGAGAGRLVVTVRPSPKANLVNTVTFSILLLALVLASALSVMLLFSNFRDKAELAKSVLGRIQQGDLKARFSTSRWDEFSQVLVLFNQMAAEIERLVEQLRAKEKARVHLLQELTHDLRTPVSSLRNLVESLRFNKAELSEDDQEELTDLAYQETEYLTRLVEDLLFLALVFEPKYKAESGTVDVHELLSEQIAAVAKSYPNIKYTLPETSALRVIGHPQQLRRLLRNALDNAFSFARQKVEVLTEEAGSSVRVAICDDGPGFSNESLKSFGHKRATRYQARKEKDRLSVGLGSVIMSAIVNSHGGNLQAENRAALNGEILGSQLTITLAETPGRTLN